MEGTGGFFEADGARLYGVLHTPAGGAAEQGAVLVPPFMEERQDAHPVLRDAAERLTERGVAALRFDLFGTGDSEGDWSEATLERWERDVRGAAEWLRRETGVRHVTLFGLRFGGTLAARVAASLRPDRLILWKPVVRGERYLGELLRAHVAAEMVLLKRAGLTREALLAALRAGQSINLFGYDLTPAQYEAIAAVDLARELSGYAGRALLVDVVHNASAPPSAELTALAAAMGPGAQVVRAVEAQALHTEGRLVYAHTQEAAPASADWLRKN